MSNDDGVVPGLDYQADAEPRKKWGFAEYAAAAVIVFVGVPVLFVVSGAICWVAVSIWRAIL